MFIGRLVSVVGCMLYNCWGKLMCRVGFVHCCIIVGEVGLFTPPPEDKLRPQSSITTQVF